VGQLGKKGRWRKKELKFEFQNWFLGLGKLITEYVVTEIIGKKFQKIVENLGRQECELEWILEHKNLEREFQTSRNFRKCQYAIPSHAT
jgi:hypothetical protein